MNDLTPRLKTFLLILILVGVCGRLYDFTAPWKTHDHYNFGGVWTTTYAECLKTTPLSISKGIPHTGCFEGKPSYYRAHEPTLLFAMWGWSTFMGDSEGSYRLFIFIFSALNVLLIFKIARLARPEPLFAWLAAVFQSGFLGGLYFGTHPDFIGEFTVFFVLLTAWLALKGRITLAAFGALAAGFSSWPGYIAFGPLWIYTQLVKRGRKRVFLMGAFGFACALATMMWLHQTVDIADFLHTKIVNPGYIARKEKGPFELFYFLMNFVRSQARLLSPLFCIFAFFELIRREGADFATGWRTRWSGLTKFHHAVLLSGGTGFLYAVIGHEYVMVHIFLYLLLLPAFSLTAARGFEHFLSGEMLSRSDKITISVLGVLFAALYPYGVFKTNAVHDALNSTAFILAVLVFIGMVWRTKKLSPTLLCGLLAVGVLTNLSQMINYRNEPDTERSFCLKARKNFEATGQTLQTNEPRSDAKDLMYCRDIPIDYIGN